MPYTTTKWLPEHFIGGHPALDLANAVFNRRVPEPDNELLKSARDIGNWLKASGLASSREAAAVARIAPESFVDRTHAVREATAQLFGSIAAAREPASEPLSFLFQSAASGLAGGAVGLRGTRPELALARWRDPEAVTAFMAMLSIEGFFNLPRESCAPALAANGCSWTRRAAGSAAGAACGHAETARRCRGTGSLPSFAASRCRSHSGGRSVS